MGIRKRGSAFQVYVYDPNEQRQVTATVSTRRQAEKKEAEIKAAITLNKKAPVRITEAKKEVYHEEKSLSLSDALIIYLKNVPLSKESKRQRIYVFRNIFRGYENRPIEFIAKHIQIILLEYFSLLKLSSITKNLRITYIAVFFNWCVENNLIRETPKIKKFPNARNRKFIPPTQEEIAAMLSVASPKYQRIIIIGSQLGVRVGASELLRIQWKDVDWNRRVLILNSANKNKSEPFREIPLSQAMYKLFRIWYEEDTAKGITYIINHYGRPIGKIYLENWDKMVKKAGITRHIRPYDLRHAFATEAIAAGADIGTVAKLMGHADTTMILRHYQYVMDSQKQAVMEKMPTEICVKTLCQSCVKKNLQ